MLIAAPHIVDQNIQPVVRGPNALEDGGRLAVNAVVTAHGHALPAELCHGLSRLLYGAGYVHRPLALFHGAAGKVHRCTRLA
jgi:hypothetical protein